MKKIVITCGNCYKDKEIDLSSIGKELKQFFNEHKTRIGNTYCRMESIFINYDIFKDQEQNDEK